MNHETDMLVAALRKVVASGGEHLLFKVSKQEGLFVSKTGLAAEVAQNALDRQFIELVRSEGEGKKLCQWVKITAKGIRFLHERESPVRSGWCECRKGLRKYLKNFCKRLVSGL
jgi:hypothetical protein